jgi:uracil-DNA glycosylase family protein
LADRRRQLQEARRAAATCRRCDLWRKATQVVFGEGAVEAPLLLVGEQPGDHEDEAGRPFVGPAGTLLRTVLAEVGVPEEEVYVTNAVKHFKFTERGTRRIHDKPNRTEIRACDHWLRIELDLVRPALVVCLGATAAQAIIGRDFRITERRGEILPPLDGGPSVLATFHPSAILRARTPQDRERSMAGLAADLSTAAAFVATVASR